MRRRQIRRHDVVAVIAPFIVGRVLVIGALGAVHQMRDHFNSVHTPVQTVGFFGLRTRRSMPRSCATDTPAVDRTDRATVCASSRCIHSPRLLGGSHLALLTVTNVTMLISIILVRELARAWTDERIADTATWLWAIGPGALASVMAYAEPLFVMLVCVVFVALNAPALAESGDTWTATEWAWLAAATVAGGLAALTRPVGAVLVVVVAVYAWQWRRPQILVAAIGPLVGLGSFLLWAGNLDPLRLQSESNLRGKFVDPARAVWGAIHDSIRDHRTGPILHVGWAVIAVTLIIAGWRRLPPAATAYTLRIDRRRAHLLQPRQLRALPLRRVPSSHRRRPRRAPPPSGIRSHRRPRRAR